MKFFILRLLCVVALGSYLVGCGLESSEFALPKGNAEAGKQAFVQYRCNDCHNIADIEYMGAEVGTKHLGKPSTGKLLVELGGKTSRSRSQAELVTAVINPSHKISTAYARHGATTQSPMRNYNEVMTVQDLVDIVEFLQTEYDVTPARLIHHDYSEQSRKDTEKASGPKQAPPKNE